MSFEQKRISYLNDKIRRNQEYLTKIKLECEIYLKQESDTYYETEADEVLMSDLIRYCDENNIEYSKAKIVDGELRRIKIIDLDVKLKEVLRTKRRIDSTLVENDEYMVLLDHYESFL